MFNAYPVTGSFSRSAVNNDSGAKSPISAMVTATLVGFVLILLTGVFEEMPLCVLGAIVIAGVFGLLDYDEALYLWKVHRFDFTVWIIACFGTMLIGVEPGLAIAVGVSLLIVVYESAYPHTSVLGRLPGSAVYRDIKQYPEAERYDGIVLTRIDAPLYFANAQNIRDKIRKYRLEAEQELETSSPRIAVKYLIIELGSVAHIDTSALHILEDMNSNYASRGQQLCFTNPSLKVMECLVASGLADKVGRDHFFISLHDAVNWCLNEMDCEAVSVFESSQGVPPASVSSAV
jgi:sulfate transporter 4